MTHSGEQRIVVDWDATLVEGIWPDYGDWLPGAREALRQLVNEGYEVVIHSTRLAPCGLDEVTQLTHEARQKEIVYIRNMLNRAGLIPVTIWNKPWKPGALHYIDDKAIEFRGDWDDVMARVLNGSKGSKSLSKKNPHPRVPLEAGKGLGGDYGGITGMRDVGIGQPIRTFDTGATRNDDSEELDYEGFISPLAWRAFARYMHEHRFQADGSLRASDNWQKGIPAESYVKSLIRHTQDVWMNHRVYTGRSDMRNALCGVIFNAQGLLHEMEREAG